VPGSRVRAELRALAELFALCGFAVAQPLLDVFGGAPDQLALRGIQRGDAWAFAALVVLGPPLALWVAELALGLAGRRPRRVGHRLALVGLAAVFVVQAARPLASGAVLYALAAVAAAVLLVLYVRARAARLWLACTAVAPLAFALVFLFASDASRLFDSYRALAIEGGIRAPAPVVMVVLDELPLATLLTADGEIDADLYPAFAELARGSSWFRQTTTVSSTTAYAVPSILTARLPVEGAKPFASDHPENLFTLLGGSYDLHVSEAITRLCPVNLCDPPDTGPTGGLRALLGDARQVMRSRLSPSGSSDRDALAALDERDEPAGEPGPSTDADQAAAFRADVAVNQPSRFQDLLASLDDVDLSLHYTHLLLPHQAFLHLPDGTTYPDREPAVGKTFDTWSSEDPTLAPHVRQRHILQTMYTDALLGELVDTLRDQGLYDDVLLVVVADHGIAFDPGGAVRGALAQSMTDEVAAQLMYVPFFLKAPGQTAGRVVDGNVWSIDVLPTMADVLDLQIPWEVDGRSALGELRPEGETALHVSGAAFTSNPTRGPRRDGDSRALWEALLTRTVDRFLPPAAGDPLRPWRTGPRPDLVGLEVGAAGAGVRRVAIDLDLHGDLDLDIEAGARELPALVRATSRELHAGDDVVVAVNGVIGASARVGTDGAVRAVLPGGLYRTGPNDVGVYLLAG
jgi:hypothetical protein